MARSRNIKPGFFKNEELADLDPHCRLLFIGLWTLADKEGRLEYRPRRIKAEIFPYENIEIEPYIEALESCMFLTRFMHDGAWIIQVCNWRKHQHPHHKEVGSVIPSEENANQNNSLAVHDSSTDHAQAKHDNLGECEHGADPSDSLNLIPDSLNSDSLCADSLPRTNTKSHFCPNDFIPNQILVRQANVQPGVNLDYEFSLFKLHEFAQPKSDWDRAWIAWLTRAKPNSQSGDKGQKTTKALQDFVSG